MGRPNATFAYTHTAPGAIDMTNHDDRVAQMLDDQSFHIEFHGYLCASPAERPYGS